MSFQLQWILFPDVFVINFTLVVDPENQRGYGKNSTIVATPYRVICEHFRVSISSKFPCSSLKHMTFQAKSSGKQIDSFFYKIIEFEK